MDISLLFLQTTPIDFKLAVDLTFHAGFAAGLSQVLTNIAKTIEPRISGQRAVHSTVLGFSLASAFLLRLAGGGAFDKVGIASAVIVGIMGAGGAVGITRFQRKVDE